MSIIILSTEKNVSEYIHHAKKAGSDLAATWNQYVVDPLWPTLSQYAPFDLSDRKPLSISNLDELAMQNKKNAGLDIRNLQKEFERIAQLLPIDDEAPTYVALYPLDNKNTVIKEKQNGIVGSSIFGNIIIHINPLAEEWEKWIPFVFSHEYHHCIWGDYWFSVRKGEGVEHSFLEYLITEGQADCFAHHVFPNLIPQWNQRCGKDMEASVWRLMQPILESKDSEVHQKFMFGDESLGIPWCVGYSIGSAIVTSYVRNHPQITCMEMIQLTAKEILHGSRFCSDI